MNRVDLRSDTVTWPTPAMREAMARADVGDDVYGEDPTVNRLEERAAEKLGKEAAMFVPSGTMGNLTSLMTHCRRGDEAILGSMAHIFYYEAGGISGVGGIQSFQIPNNPDGTLPLERVEAAIRKDDEHFPVSRVLALENTHNRCGGAALSVEYTRAAGELAHSHGLALHIDGARIFNAATALGVDVAELVAPADSVTFCLSKGLCAPAGSVVCGSRAFIKQARRVRKQLGGAMRQSGVLAAAGLIALDEMSLRLHEDHARAKRLASGLGRLPGVVLDEGTPHTNMVYVGLDKDLPFGAEFFAKKLRENNVLVGVVSARRFRLVVHYWIDDAGVQTTVDTFAELFKKYAQEPAIL